MKRITYTLGIVLLLTISVVGQIHLPTFNSLSVSPKTVTNSDAIELTINAYDSINGIRDVAVSIFDPKNEFIDQVVMTSDKYIGNNTYQTKYQISKWAMSGVYTIKEIVIINNVDGILFNTTQRDSFTVVSSSPDIKPPMISSVKIYADTLNISDTLKIEFEARDDVSGLSFLWFDLYNPRNALVYSDIRYFNSNTIQSLGNNKYILEKTIPLSAIKGNWHFNFRIYDIADNGFLYEDTTKIFVNGIYKDVTPPVIHSLKAYPDTIDLLDSLHVVLETEDIESGLGKMYVYLIREQNNYVSFNYDFNKSEVPNVGQNKYLLDLAVPDWFQKGNGYVKIVLYDNADNGVQIETSQIYITGQIDSTKLGVGKVDLKNSLLTLYPNPFNDFVIVKFIDNSFNKALLKIYNTTGNLIDERKIVSDEPIDLSHFSTGIYCFVIITDKYRISRLVIKK